MRLNKEVCKKCWMGFISGSEHKQQIYHHVWWNDKNRFRCWKFRGLEITKKDMNKLFEKIDCSFELEHTVSND